MTRLRSTMLEYWPSPQHCPLDFDDTLQQHLAYFTLSTFSYPHLSLRRLLEAALLCWSHTFLALREVSPWQHHLAPVPSQPCHHPLLRLSPAPSQAHSHILSISPSPQLTSHLQYLLDCVSSEEDLGYALSWQCLNVLFSRWGYISCSHGVICVSSAWRSEKQPSWAFLPLLRQCCDQQGLLLLQIFLLFSQSWLLTPSGCLSPIWGDG